MYLKVQFIEYMLLNALSKPKDRRVATLLFCRQAKRASLSLRAKALKGYHRAVLCTSEHGLEIRTSPIQELILLSAGFWFYIPLKRAEEIFF
jgi:hypothetical protein